MKIGSYQVGRVTVVVPREAIVQTEVDDVRRAVEQVVTPGSGWVVIDLGEVPFIDSAGLESLCDLQQFCMDNRGRLKLAAPSEICSEILRLTDLTGRFETYDSVEEAARSVA
jgi:anti-anti-sigma factor